MQAAQMTLVLDNRDGRFTPKLAAGAYYPNITRNVRIRLSVDSQSMTAVAYSGYRFWGEVTSWPPKWDPTGRDVYVQVTCSGIWRRISQKNKSIGSPFSRYYHRLTGGDIPIGYWTFEDGGNSADFVAEIGTNATFTGGPPSFAANTAFRGSDGIVVLNGAMITCTVPGTGTPTNNCVRFLLSVPAEGDSASGTSSWCICEADTSGTVAKLEVYLHWDDGTLGFQGLSNVGAVLFSANGVTIVRNNPVLVSMELTPAAPNINWAFRLIRPGDGAILESLTGTRNAASINKVTSLKFGRANALQDTAIGHPAVMYTVPSLVTAAYPLNGYSGEYAMTRFTRVCAEEGIASETIGNAADTAQMGPQLDQQLSEVLMSCEDADYGLLYESRAQFGLGYRSRASLVGQAAAAAINYTGKMISEELSPTFDDQFTKNNVTVTNWNGYVSQSILTSGAMSVLDPPNGIGAGYEYTKDVNVYLNSQVGTLAALILGIGSVDEVRIPSVQLDMRRSAVASLFAAVPGIRIGDYVTITNPPSFYAAATIKLLVWGYTETLNAIVWTFTLNTVPESPFEAGYSPGVVTTTQKPGGIPVSKQAELSKSVASLLNDGSITPAMLNNGITSFVLGGIRTTIAAAAPTDPAPNDGDIWIDSVTGQLNRYDAGGPSWVPITFDGDTVIDANSITAASIAALTITAAQIAGHTITAAELAAGIVYAGIVDATEIDGAILRAKNASGATIMTINKTSGTWMLYKDTGGASQGMLIASASRIATTDEFANAVRPGVCNYDLISGTYYAVRTDNGYVYFDKAAAADGPWSTYSSIRPNTVTGWIGYFNTAGTEFNVGHREVSGNNDQHITNTSSVGITGSDVAVEANAYRLTWDIFYYPGAGTTTAPKWRHSVGGGAVVSFVFSNYWFTTSNSMINRVIGATANYSQDQSGPGLGGSHDNPMYMHVEEFVTFTAGGTAGMMAAKGDVGSDFYIAAVFARAEKREFI